MSAAPGRPRLTESITALDALLDLGPGRLDAALVDEALALRARIDERLALGDGLGVVALVGGTGVGKSALVNRLVGAEPHAPVVEEGVRRPTTSHPIAVSGAGTQPGEDVPLRALLSWLGIGDVVTSPGALPDGLVLIDLPDHDSVVDAHRETASRLARRVDGLFVVVDPVKYARADLHDGPLAELAEHAEVVTVVLNRSDEVAADDVERLLADLRTRLAADGLADAQVVATSAATGEGIATLRGILEDLATSRTVAQRRLAADTADLARRAEADLAVLPDPVPDPTRLVEALLDATDAHRIVGEAEVAYRRDARRALRSPLARLVWLPLRGVGSVARSFGVGDPAATGGPPPVSVARVEAALAGELRLHDTHGVAHARLADTLHTLSHQGAPVLADAVGGIGIRPRHRRWWTGFATLRGLAEATAVVGAVWLLLLGFGDWLRLPELPTPRVTDALTWPTALLLGGLAVRVLLGLVSRLAVARGARRHRRACTRAIRGRLTETTRERLLTPYAEERDRQTRLRTALHEAIPDVGSTNGIRRISRRCR